MICRKCLINKDESKFYIKNIERNDIICKKCIKERNKKYHIENKEKRKDKNSLYYKNNKEKRKDYNKMYQLTNKEKLKIKRKEYVEDNREKLNEGLRDHYKNNKKYRIDKYMFSALREAIKKNKESKYFFGLIGYSFIDTISNFNITCPEELSMYLKENTLFSIDHIIPKYLYKYNKKDDKECLKCWNYKNLRIISIKENNEKKKKLDMNLVKKYKIGHLMPKGV